MIPRWKEAREHFEALIDLENKAQEAGLRELTSRDSELAEIVRDLIRLDRASEQELPGSLGFEAEGASDRRVVGRFHLRHRMATGRLSSVWAAARSDGAFEQEVAIKLIDVEAMARDLGCEPREAVGHERRLLARVDSPHVVRLLDAGELDGETEWLALERLEGESIGDHCKRRKLDIEGRVRLVVDVCRGVEACHSAGVLHLDIAPTNVIVTRGGAVRIIDLGAGAPLRSTASEGSDRGGCSGRARARTQRQGSEESATCGRVGRGRAVRDAQGRAAKNGDGLRAAPRLGAMAAR